MKTNVIETKMSINGVKHRLIVQTITDKYGFTNWQVIHTIGDTKFVYYHTIYNDAIKTYKTIFNTHIS